MARATRQVEPRPDEGDDFEGHFPEPRSAAHAPAAEIRPPAQEKRLDDELRTIGNAIPPSEWGAEHGLEWLEDR